MYRLHTGYVIRLFKGMKQVIILRHKSESREPSMKQVIVNLQFITWLNLVIWHFLKCLSSER